MTLNKWRYVAGIGVQLIWQFWLFANIIEVRNLSASSFHHRY